MNRKYDIIALGELLIDFTMNGTSSGGNSLFEACPGGAPCNVLSMANKYGKKTSFTGKVGKDIFGTMLKETLVKAGIDTSHLYMDDQVNTTLAFVRNLDDGERAFSFYRNPGADMMLKEEEIQEEYIKEGKIFHFGTLSMTHEGVRKATVKAAGFAKKNHLLISFDPNYRPLLWKSPEEAKEQMDYGFRSCDILKIADNELQFFTGKEDNEEGMKALLEAYPIPLVFLTLGKEGSRAYYKGTRTEAPAFRVNAIDTTGAGDTFMGVALSMISDYGLENLTGQQIEEILVQANAAAAIVTTRKGAVNSMPDRKETEELIRRKK